MIIFLVVAIRRSQKGTFRTKNRGKKRWRTSFSSCLSNHARPLQRSCDDSKRSFLQQEIILLFKELDFKEKVIFCLVVQTWNGRTYERSAIVAHIRAKGRDPVDPNRVLTEADLAPNLAIKVHSSHKISILQQSFNFLLSLFRKRLPHT